MTRRPRLTSEEITARLNMIPGWTQTGERLEKKYRLPDFLQALAFVNTVGEAAEAAQHHPDISIRYSLVTLQWWTWGSGGVTELDFELAARCDQIYQALQGKA